MRPGRRVGQNSAERDLRLAPGESMDLAGYLFEGRASTEGPNFTSTKAPSAWCNGKEVAVLYPEKRLYTVQSSMMTEAGRRWFHPWHSNAALGEPLRWRLGGARACQTVCALDLVRGVDHWYQVCSRR